MSQSGYTPIQIYSSSTATNAPSPSNLLNSSLGSELAINITDGKLFYKDNSGAVQVIATKTGASATVSSVAMTVPTFLSVTGSPITSSGTLAVSLSGTALPVLNGGTGQTSYTDGQLLIGNSTGNTLAKSTLTAGTGITITNGSGSITIASTVSPMVYPSAGIAVSTGSAWSTSLTAPSGAIVGTTDTQTLTNKRVTSRSLAAASATGTVTPNSDSYDQVNYLLTGTVAIATPSGTPTDGQRLSIRLYAASTQTVSWTTTAGGYRVIGTTLPLSVASTKTVYVGCIYNSADTFWDVVAVATQA